MGCTSGCAWVHMDSHRGAHLGAGDFFIFLFFFLGGVCEGYLPAPPQAASTRAPPLTAPPYPLATVLATIMPRLVQRGFRPEFHNRLQRGQRPSYGRNHTMFHVKREERRKSYGANNESGAGGALGAPDQPQRQVHPSIQRVGADK